MGNPLRSIIINNKLDNKTTAIENVIASSVIAENDTTQTVPNVILLPDRPGYGKENTRRRPSPKANKKAGASSPSESDEDQKTPNQGKRSPNSVFKNANKQARNGSRGNKRDSLVNKARADDYQRQLGENDARWRVRVEKAEAEKEELLKKTRKEEEAKRAEEEAELQAHNALILSISRSSIIPFSQLPPTFYPKDRMRFYEMMNNIVLGYYVVIFGLWSADLADNNMLPLETFRFWVFNAVFLVMVYFPILTEWFFPLAVKIEFDLKSLKITRGVDLRTDSHSGATLRHKAIYECDYKLSYGYHYSTMNWLDYWAKFMYTIVIIALNFGLMNLGLLTTVYGQVDFAIAALACQYRLWQIFQLQHLDKGRTNVEWMFQAANYCTQNPHSSFEVINKRMDRFLATYNGANFNRYILGENPVLHSLRLARIYCLHSTYRFRPNDLDFL